MGLADSQCRVIYLQSGISDLEFGMGQIAQKRSTLAYQAQYVAESDPSMAAQLHMMDKQLEMEMKTLETQYKIKSSELESVQKFVDNNVKQFKYA